MNKQRGVVLDSGHIVIFVTAKDKEEALKISEVLLDDKLAACVNIIGQVESLFWWQGKINEENESMLVIKSKHSLLPEIIDKVKGVHTYSVPEIIALPIVGGDEDYLKWIDESVRMDKY